MEFFGVLIEFMIVYATTNFKLKTTRRNIDESKY